MVHPTTEIRVRSTAPWRRGAGIATVALVASVAAGCSSTPPASTPDGGSSAPSATSAAADAAAPTSLVAVIGTADDPDAYEIAITDEDGNELTTVPAGTYELRFDDRTPLHNFRLTGTGVDVATSVAGEDTTTVEVTLVEGAYDFVCDPHPAMAGVLEVTG